MTNKVFHASQISHFEFDLYAGRYTPDIHVVFKHFPSFWFRFSWYFACVWELFLTSTISENKSRIHRHWYMAGTHLFRIIVLLFLYSFAFYKLFTSLVDIRFEYFALFDVLKIANGLKTLGTNIHCALSVFLDAILCSLEMRIRIRMSQNQW